MPLVILKLLEEEITLQLTVTVPTTLVPCILELDMVQEIVTWFKDGGSNTLKFRFQPEDEQFQVAPIRPRILRVLEDSLPSQKEMAQG